MDGAGSEIMDSETGTLRGPRSENVRFPLPSFAALDGHVDTGHAASSGNESTALRMNGQGKEDGISRQTNDIHQSIMYPAQVHLRCDRAKSLPEEQWGELYSLNAPQDQVARRGKDARTIGRGFRTRKPHPYFGVYATPTGPARPDAPQGSRSETKRLGTH